jgi:hypothetical protein
MICRIARWENKVFQAIKEKGYSENLSIQISLGYHEPRGRS